MLHAPLSRGLLGKECLDPGIEAPHEQCKPRERRAYIVCSQQGARLAINFLLLLQLWVCSSLAPAIQERGVLKSCALNKARLTIDFFLGATSGVVPPSSPPPKILSAFKRPSRVAPG